MGNPRHQLEDAVKEIESHNLEYQHRTPEEKLVAYRDAVVNDDELQRSRDDVKRLTTERDRLAARNESLEATHKLWSRVEPYLPQIGLICDGEGCNAAIGIVGVKLIDVDVLKPECDNLGALLGWYCAEKHLCPKCRNKETTP